MYKYLHPKAGNYYSFTMNIPTYVYFFIYIFFCLKLIYLHKILLLLKDKSYKGILSCFKLPKFKCYIQ